MPFVQPQFNLQVGIYRQGSSIFNCPDVVSAANLSPGRVLGVALPEGLDVPIGVGGMWLRVPKGTDIRDIRANGKEDFVVCPAGTWRTYRVAWVDDIGGGFANEHRFAVIQPTGNWPVPFVACDASLQPFPVGLPALLGTKTTGGAAQNLLQETYTLCYTGIIWHFVQWFDAAQPPQCNGQAPLSGTVVFYTGALHQARYAVFRIPVVAGVFTVNTNFFMVAPRPFSVASFFEPFTAGHFDATSNTNGMGSQPIATAIPNPFLVPVTLMFGLMGTQTPPVGWVNNPPYTRLVTLTDVIGGVTFVLDILAMNPPLVLPNATWAPAGMLWQNWGTQSVEAA